MFAKKLNLIIIYLFTVTINYLLYPIEKIRSYSVIRAFKDLKIIDNIFFLGYTLHIKCFDFQINILKEYILGGDLLKIPSLKIGDLVAKFPIIQGGMGIGVSRSSLASAVANAGGIGVISGVQIGFKDPDFFKNPLKANLKALSEEIKKAKELAPKGIIGLNLMVAMKNYEEYVRTAVKEKIDLIISGAGLPIDLPEFVKGSDTKIAPIVSSGKAARVIIKRWLRQDRFPDAVIVEGPLAGGHLGFKRDELENNSNQSLDDIVTDVKKVLSVYEDEYNIKIPVIAAGGIMNGKDIKKMLTQGADGVQMGTRFVTTVECDASQAFKDAYVNAKDEDAMLIQSPVGMPGRAIKNNFIEQTLEGPVPVKKCYNCVHKCNPANTPYCITQALMDSVIGENGLVFSGARVGEANDIITVDALMNELVSEIQQ